MNRSNASNNRSQQLQDRNRRTIKGKQAVHAPVVISTIDVVIINVTEKNPTQSPSNTRLAQMQGLLDGTYVQRVPVPVIDNDRVDLLSLVSDAQLSLYKQQTGDNTLDRLQLTPLYQATHTSTGRNGLFMFRDDDNIFCQFLDGSDLTTTLMASTDNFVKSKFVLYIRLSEMENVDGESLFFLAISAQSRSLFIVFSFIVLAFTQKVFDPQRYHAAIKMR